MTYLNFLILFVVTPLIVLTIIFRRDLNDRWLRSIATLCVVAVVWTTPWDNFLVATDVWWYDDDLVLGIILGYVPLEEYMFFVLQSMMTGVFLVGLLRWLPPKDKPFRQLPFYSTIPLLLGLGVLVLVMLATGDERFNYLILEIGWLALFPIALQWLWGFDIILHYGRAALVAIIVPTIWLTAMDAVAISAGTWTIDPAQTIGLKFGGVVPIEEGVFFLITNTLIVQGLLLFYTSESWQRLAQLRSRLISAT